VKFEQSVLRAFALAAVSVFALVVPGCKLGPINYDAFEKRTIEENLAAIDSAGSLYAAQLAAGNIDAGAQQACAYLLSQLGVDTAVISPDSSVWAFFTSGLLAGVGNVRRDTTGLPAAEPSRLPDVRMQAGGETGGFPHFILPFDQELPCAKLAAEAIKEEVKRRLIWEESETFTGSAVDIGMTLGVINHGSGVIFWSGHGELYPPEPGSPWSSGLLLGNSYNREAMAAAAVAQCAGYMNPGPGQQRQAAVIRHPNGKFYVVILPPFIRAHGDFHVGENPYINEGKTIVHLSCCFSAYGGELMQSFIDAGADVVCGYDWAVGDLFSSGIDELFFRRMCDTCFPNEAMRLVGSLTDPEPYLKKQATFRMVGDTTVLLRAVLQAGVRNNLYRVSSATASIGSASLISGMMHAEGHAENIGNLQIIFPGSAPGNFDVTKTDDAMIWWADITTGRSYRVLKDFVGVSGTIKVDRCASDIMTGSFSGELGYWGTNNPYEVPPMEVVTFKEGIFKYTGKITVGAPGIGWPGGEAAMQLIGRAGDAAMAR
jgi:hypothetical protein